MGEMFESIFGMMKIFMLIPIIFVVIIAVLIITTILKKRKKENVADTDTLVDTVKNKIKEHAQTQKNKKVCPYCGNGFKDDDTRCSSCGANRQM